MTGFVRHLLFNDLDLALFETSIFVMKPSKLHGILCYPRDGKFDFLWYIFKNW